MNHPVSAVIALTLFASTAAVAQSGTQNRQDQHNQQYQDDRGRSDSRNSNQAVNDRPHWSRGDSLPDQYRQDRYAVGDWRQHNLRTPPQGYHWVRNDSDQYLLAAISTGVILESVSQNQYREDYQWSRGERLSGGYLESRNVVSDWRAKRLRRPPQGYHWVRANNQYVLAAIASGVIAEIVLNNR